MIMAFSCMVGRDASLDAKASVIGGQTRLLRIVGLFCLATGVLIDLAKDSLAVSERTPLPPSEGPVRTR